MKMTAPWWITTCLISAVFVGCGSSNNDTGTTPPPTGGFGATGVVAGTTAGAGGSTVVSVACGATTCTNPAGAILTQLKAVLPSAMLATPCCDTATTTCGWVINGACTVPPPKKNCPAPAAIPGFGGGLSACCNASNKCGIDAYAIGMGCMSSFGGAAPADCDTGVAPATGGTSGGTAGSTATAGSTGAAGAAGAHAGAGGGAAGATAGSGAAGSAGAHAGSGGSTGSAGHTAGAGGH